MKGIKLCFQQAWENDKCKAAFWAIVVYLIMAIFRFCPELIYIMLFGTDKTITINLIRESCLLYMTGYVIYNENYRFRN